MQAAASLLTRLELRPSLVGVLRRLCTEASDERRCSTVLVQYGSKRVDFVWIDQEHSPMSPEALQAHILAAHGTA